MSHEIVEALPTTTQQNIYPLHPTVTTSHNKIDTALPQTIVQSTVVPSFFLKNLHKDNQTNRPIIKIRQP